MIDNGPHLIQKLLWNLPWLLRYPAWRIRKLLEQATSPERETHLILVVANHFEPAYNEEINEHGGLGVPLAESEQLIRLDDWCRQARSIGQSVRDHDGTPFRHTNFYPAEQYHRSLLDRLAELQAEGLGEVEIHLHHGIEQPDTSEHFRKVLVDFRDVIAAEHRCLSRSPDSDLPQYAFVHGNLALANSAGGKYCGVDDEMEILRDTGCYADLTLPSAPDQSQVPRINAIYECGGQLDQRVPHYSGPAIRVGHTPSLPLIFTGPLLLDWRRNGFGVPVPRLENGSLTLKGPLDLHRVELWRRAAISVAGRPEWIFAKLYCHGFFAEDQPAVIGAEIKEGLLRLLESADRVGNLKIHFATAREAFNMTIAAAEGHSGEPGSFRNHYLRTIMELDSTSKPEKAEASLLA